MVFIQHKRVLAKKGELEATATEATKSMQDITLKCVNSRARPNRSAAGAPPLSLSYKTMSVTTSSSKTQTDKQITSASGKDSIVGAQLMSKCSF